MTDKDLGLKVLRSFWEWNSRLYPIDFNISFDEFLKSYGKKIDIYLDGIGGGVRSAGVSDTQIETAMRALANSSKGKIPSDYQVYFKFLINEATKINWIDAGAFVLKESAGDIVEGAAEFGDQLIFTGKILNFLLPVILLVVVWYLLNKGTEGQFSKAVRGLRK